MEKKKNDGKPAKKRAKKNEKRTRNEKTRRIEGDMKKREQGAISPFQPKS